MPAGPTRVSTHTSGALCAGGGADAARAPVAGRDLASSTDNPKRDAPGPQVEDWTKRPAPRPGAPVMLAIDAMSGDHGPVKILGGLARIAAEDPEIRFLLHGAAEDLEELLAELPGLAAVSEIIACDSVVPMDAQPSQALRRGKRSSMWMAIDSVADGRAHAALSAGNTGALMTMATVRLRPIEGVGRPAIAALWPAVEKERFSVVLDVGADVRASADNLLDYAIMGAEYARVALGLARPRVGLLNVGVEAAKGPALLREVAERLEQAARQTEFDFVGYVEADGIGALAADVVVTDGFTGNIALKSAEGAARQVGGYLRDALEGSVVGRVGAVIAKPALRVFKRRIDPRRVNGGVFLGLNGLVVKSHGAADEVGVAAAVALTARTARRDIVGRIAARVAKRGAVDTAPGGGGEPRRLAAGGSSERADTSGRPAGSAGFATGSG